MPKNAAVVEDKVLNEILKAEEAARRAAAEVGQ